jgi:hypothetical protein
MVEGIRAQNECFDFTNVKKAKIAPPPVDAYYSAEIVRNDSGEFQIANMVPGVEIILKNAPTEDDPVIIVGWNGVVLSNQLAAYNAAAAPPARPAWLLPAAGAVAMDQFQRSLLAHLRTAAGAGNVEGICIIAPNTMVEFGRVRDAVTALSFDPFMIAFVGVGGAALGQMYINLTVNTVQPVGAVPLPPGAVRIFN